MGEAERVVGTHRFLREKANKGARTSRNTWKKSM